MPSRAEDRARVFINGAEIEWLHVVSVSRSAGGAKNDIATLELSHLYGEPWRSDVLTGAAAFGHRVCRIDIDGEVIHLGEVTAESASLGSEGTVQWVSRLEPRHFGEPLSGMREMSPANWTVETNMADVVFNPVRDGVIAANMSERVDPTPGFYRVTAGRHLPPRLFMDPDSGYTESALNTQASRRSQRWNLLYAVEYLCLVCNRTAGTGTVAKHRLAGRQLATSLLTIANPARIELQRVVGRDDSLLKNVTVRLGAYLPECLDSLLDPFGFGWYVRFSGGPQIVVFRRGVGPAKVVHRQAPGSQVDPLRTNLEALSLSADMSCEINELTVYGDVDEVEDTWELQRGWPESLDDIDLTADIDQVAVTGEEYQTDHLYRAAWRKWVLNEAGDYTDLRTDAHLTDLGVSFGDEVVAKRRRFFPTLTLGPEGAPIGSTQGCHVEVSLDAGETWQPVETLNGVSCHVLENECGVMFDGHIPPLEMQAAGADCRLRVTACVRSDRRLVGGAIAGPGRLGTRNALVLDCREKFCRKWRAEECVFNVGARLWSKLFAAMKAYGTTPADRLKVGGEKPDGARDDSEAIREYARTLLAAWHQRDLGGTLRVSRLRSGGTIGDYEIGDVITTIRGLVDERGGPGLLANVPASATPNYAAVPARYVQVVGIDYDVAEQCRVLRVETYRDPGK